MNNKELTISQSDFLLYSTEDGQINIDVTFQEETVWLSLNQMAELFQREKSVISKHIKNVFAEGEIEPDQTVAKFATVQIEGQKKVSRLTSYFNLDVIISVGYRVRSHRGTQFRIWATQRIKEYLIKGFVLDDKRLKQSGGGNYFDELLARIRDIRSSEKIFYKKILDIFATSIDYDSKIDTSKTFFQTVQNKMHWGAHGHTAAEVVFERSDANKPNMGLTSWEGDRIRKTDVVVGKNYLTADELDTLNRVVNLYLDFAELQAKDRKAMYMSDWITKLDEFLKISGRELLEHAGKISHEMASKKAEKEYDTYKDVIKDHSSPVEKHFIEAIEATKQIEAQSKKKPK